MRQFLLGALCGATITAALVSLFSGGPRDSVTFAASATDKTVSLTRSTTDPPLQGANPARDPSQGQRASPVTLAATDAEPQIDARSAPSTRTIPRDGPLPIRLSADHAAILTPPNPAGHQLTLPELHAILSLEKKDVDWAWKTEQLLAQHFAQRNNTGEFEVLSIECRTTLCEVLAFGNLPTSPLRWAQIVGEMSNQPWWTNFHTSTTNVTEKHGRGALVTILQRARQ